MTGSMVEMKERIDYLDALKAICIILVVFCHSALLPENSVWGNVVMTLSWAAVPCFMMISGMLMHHSSSFQWKKYLWKVIKVFSVLCIWRLVYYIVFQCMEPFSVSKTDFVQYVFFLKDLEAVNTGVMWYMIAYLVVLLLYPITYSLFKQKNWAQLKFLLALSAAAGIILPSLDWLINFLLKAMGRNGMSISGLNRILPLSNYANMTFYFMLGIFLLAYQDRIRNFFLKRKYLSAAMLVLGLCMLLLVKYADTGSFAWQGIYISGGYSHLPTAIMALGLYGCFMLHDGNVFYPWIGRIIGQHTMGIYYLHYLLLAVCSRYIFAELRPYYSFGMNCVKTVVIVTVCAGITTVLKKVPYVRELVR